MIMVIDVSVLAVEKLTGVGKLLQGLIEEFKKNKRVQLKYFALTAREHKAMLKKSFPNLIAPTIPACLYTIYVNLIQMLSIPIEVFTGKCNAVTSIGWFCWPSKSGKSIAVIPDLTPISHPNFHNKRNRELSLKWFQKIKKNANKVISISQSTKIDIQQLLNIPEDNIIVSYPDIDSNFKKKLSIKRRKKIIDKYNLPKSFIIFVGTQEPRKNLAELIKAFADIDNKIRKTTKLLLVGKKVDVEIINKPDFVQETDYVPDTDLPYIYSLARGLVYPSFKEGFGFPIIEAFIMEIPVLTSNCFSMKEIAEGAAILVDPNSTESIKKGLIRLLSLNKKEKEKLVKTGKSRLKEFSYKKMAEKILQAIKEK